MPGYALSNTNTVVTQDAVPSIAVLADTNFYGFKFDHTTSRLTVEQVTPGSGTTIQLPDDGVVAESDYKHWVWNDHDLGFSWNTDRLLLEVK
jgi:hypothetical protein